MPEPVRHALSTIQELTAPQTIQALVTVAVTFAVLLLLVRGMQVPELLSFAWFALLGLYFEVPGKKSQVI